VLVEKACAAAISNALPLLAVSGGVSANSALVARLRARTAALGLECRFPPAPLLTDNALMIAFTAAHQAASGRISHPTTEIFPSLDAVEWARSEANATRQP
jgi:tRNA A37 threonylcarbamoyltransferase TsaD